jgi:hypothetical protein
MNKSIQQILQLGVCGLVLTCGACKSDTAETPGEPEPAVTSEPAMSEPTTAVGGDWLTEQVATAVADAAARTGVTANAFTVTRASIVNWSDGSVGCPEEGRAYTQAIVSGILILLEADGEIYHYHGRDGGDVFYCPNDRAKAAAFGSMGSIES